MHIHRIPSPGEADPFLSGWAVERDLFSQRQRGKTNYDACCCQVFGAHLGGVLLSRRCCSCCRRTRLCALNPWLHPAQDLVQVG